MEVGARSPIDTQYALRQARNRSLNIETQPSSPVPEEENPINDPVYRLKAQMKAKQDSLAQTADAVTDIGMDIAGKATAKYWHGLWGTIPAIASGAGILAFAGATMASWVALGRLLFKGVAEQNLGKTSKLLPPPIGPTPDGLSMGAFFIVAHLIWALILFVIIGILIVVIIPIIQALHGLPVIFKYFL